MSRLYKLLVLLLIAHICNNKADNKLIWFSFHHTRLDS